MMGLSNSKVWKFRKSFKISQTLDVLFLLFASFLSLYLTGCSQNRQESQEGRTPAQPSVTSIDSRFVDVTSSPIPITTTPSLVPTETQVISPSTTPTTIQKVRTSTPIPASPSPVVPGLPTICYPFPSGIEYFYPTSDGKGIIQAICKGETVEFPSPIGDPEIYDYTARTGRIAYSRNIELVKDPLSLYGSYTTVGDLWVFDFNTGQDEKWLDNLVMEMTWAPVLDPQIGKQYLAVLQADRTLSIGTGPNAFSTIPNFDHLCFYSWSPLGDRIAYVRNCEIIENDCCFDRAGTAYVSPIDGGYPRKLAEHIHAAPIWALEQQAIILPSTTMRIFHLDQSNVTIPKHPDGSAIDGLCTNFFQWSPGNQMLMFAKNCQLDVSSGWIYEFSEDLKYVINYGSGCWPKFEIEQLSNGQLHIRPDQEDQVFFAKIISIRGTNLRISVVIPEHGGNDYGSWSVTLYDQTVFLDAQANPATINDFRKGMYIEFKGRIISADSFSFLAKRLRIFEPIEEETTFQGIVWNSHLDSSREYYYINFYITDPVYESEDITNMAVLLNEDTKILNKRGDSLPLSVIEEELAIEVTGQSDPENPSYFIASKIRILD